MDVMLSDYIAPHWRNASPKQWLSLFRHSRFYFKNININFHCLLDLFFKITTITFSNVQVWHWLYISNFVHKYWHLHLATFKNTAYFEVIQANINQKMRRDSQSIFFLYVEVKFPRDENESERFPQITTALEPSSQCVIFCFMIQINRANIQSLTAIFHSGTHEDFLWIEKLVKDLFALQRKQT